jgi:predicted  nucleic acid-binding Zn-ribbon protein
MEDYEINILRRDGNWKKVKPNDLIIDEIDNDLIEDNEPDQKKLQNDFLSNVTKVESIISRLESLENEKSALKEELKEFENDFLRKKKLAEDEIDKISQEKDMIEKTINVIKNLKSF